MNIYRCSTTRTMKAHFRLVFRNVTVYINADEFINWCKENAINYKRITELDKILIGMKWGK